MTEAELLAIVEYWLADAGAMVSLLLGIVCGSFFCWGCGRG